MAEASSFGQRLAAVDAEPAGGLGRGAGGRGGALDAAVGLYGAASLEEAARTAAAQVCRWLAEGRERIGIVAFDRVLARRR